MVIKYRGGGGVKTGSGSHNINSLKGEIICKILYGNWLAVIQIFIFSAKRFVMVNYFVSESH